MQYIGDGSAQLHGAQFRAVQLYVVGQAGRGVPCPGKHVHVTGNSYRGAILTSTAVRSLHACAWHVCLYRAYIYTVDRGFLG